MLPLEERGGIPWCLGQIIPDKIILGHILYRPPDKTRDTGHLYQNIKISSKLRRGYLNPKIILHQKISGCDSIEYLPGDLAL